MSVDTWVSVHCLQWCCLGKRPTSRYGYTTSMSFRQLLAKLESRFGQELVETVQVKFQTAAQQPGEGLSDWADRIRSLAARAFQDLPEHYCTQHQSIDFYKAWQTKRRVNMFVWVSQCPSSKPSMMCYGISTYTMLCMAVSQPKRTVDGHATWIMIYLLRDTGLCSPETRAATSSHAGTGTCRVR